MKAIVIYTEEWVNYEFYGTIIERVIAITDEQLSRINIKDILYKDQKFDILDLQQAYIETKEALGWRISNE